MRKLDESIQIAVLEAVVECDFNLREAASKLDIGAATLYRMFIRWKLPTPVGGNPSKMRYTDYVAKCKEIQDVLTSLQTPPLVR